MADATGEASKFLRVAFDRRVKLEFHGARITSDGGLLAYREKAPDLQLAHPTDDHFLPLLVAAGAAMAPGTAAPATFPIEGFEFGSLSRLAVRFG